MRLEARGSRAPGEVGWVLAGFSDGGLFVARRIYRAAGSPHAVRLDAGRILRREERRGDVIGFWHTHPEGLAQESDIDRDTLRMWCLSFGKPLLSVIQSGDRVVGWVHSPRAPRRFLSRIVHAKGMVLARL